MTGGPSNRRRIHFIDRLLGKYLDAEWPIFGNVCGYPATNPYEEPQFWTLSDRKRQI